MTTALESEQVVTLKESGWDLEPLNEYLYTPDELTKSSDRTNVV